MNRTHLKQEGGRTAVYLTWSWISNKMTNLGNYTMIWWEQPWGHTVFPHVSVLQGWFSANAKIDFFIFLTFLLLLLWTKTLNFDQFIPGECHAGPYCRFCFSPLITSSSQKCILFFKAKVFWLISHLLVTGFISEHYENQLSDFINPSS